MPYTPLFKAGRVERYDAAGRRTSDETARSGDRRDGSVYVYSDPIVLAINVALATERPLLIRGPSGSGKSSVARNIAFRMKRRFYEAVVTSRTQARDLQWTFDAVQRLSDASGNGEAKPLASYITPGVLWWAFDPAGARRQAAAAGGKSGPMGLVPAGRNNAPAVVLIDEIDKADPDVPNDLLVPLGSLRFDVPELDQRVQSTVEKHPLIVITTNEERELPPAFMRRCVGLNLPAPTPARLVAIARAHHPTADESLTRAIADQFIPTLPDGKPGTPIASAAEFLDAVQASIGLDISPDAVDKTWMSILDTIVSAPPPAVTAS